MIDTALLRGVILFFLLLAIGGCSHVTAYQRSKLAHPTMNELGEPGVAEEHMHAVQEGATGGSATAQSGCGCN